MISVGLFPLFVYFFLLLFPFRFVFFLLVFWVFALLPLSFVCFGFPLGDWFFLFGGSVGSFFEIR